MGGLVKGGGGIVGLLLIAAMFFLPKLLGGATGAGVGPGASGNPSEATSGGDEEACKPLNPASASLRLRREYLRRGSSIPHRDPQPGNVSCPDSSFP